MKTFWSIGLSMLCLLVFAGGLHAQCPFGGKVNCQGACGRFTDENGDGYCDFAILENVKNETKKDADETPKEKIETAKEKNETPIRSKSDLQTGKQTTKTVDQNKGAKEQQRMEDFEEEVIIEENPVETPVIEQTPTPQANKAKPYSVITVSLICLCAYFFTFALMKGGKIKKMTHRKIWNSILLITCLVSCLLGFLLAIQLNYHFGMQWLGTILKLHVEFGIAMTIIAIIHIIWHWKYYMTIFKR